MIIDEVLEGLSYLDVYVVLSLNVRSPVDRPLSVCRIAHLVRYLKNRDKFKCCTDLYDNDNGIIRLVNRGYKTVNKRNSWINTNDAK